MQCIAILHSMQCIAVRLINGSNRCLEAYSLGTHSLGVYSLGLPISDLETHAHDCGPTVQQLLGVHNLGLPTLDLRHMHWTGNLQPFERIAARNVKMSAFSCPKSFSAGVRMMKLGAVASDFYFPGKIGQSIGARGLCSIAGSAVKSGSADTSHTIQMS